MRKVRGDFGAELREFNGEDDHVHLLAGYPPKVAVPALVNSLKRVPARRMRSEFTGQVNRHIMHGHFWSPSSFAASFGGAPPGIIQQDIEQQRPSVTRLLGLPRPKDEAFTRQFRSWPWSRAAVFSSARLRTTSSSSRLSSTILPSVSSRSIAFLGSVTVTVTLFRVFPVQLAVVLAAFPDLLAVLVDLQPVLELLGPALFLGGRVPFFLLLAQRFQLAFQCVIARAGRLVGVSHAVPPAGSTGECNRCWQAS
jgi:putative transposase